MIDRNTLVPIIGLDGTLRHLPAKLIPDLQKLGWRLVTAPKRTYYPELDQTNPNWKDEGTQEVESDVLKVDVL